MSTMQAPATFDLAALRRGIEERDAECLIGLYAEDAELRVVDKTNTPSQPRVLHGKREIAEYLTDICGREMTHQVDHLMTDGRTVSFTEACQYPDGMRVLAQATMDLSDGRITRELAVQAWDE
jgi:hypothetical protein